MTNERKEPSQIITRKAKSMSDDRDTGITQVLAKSDGRLLAVVIPGDLKHLDLLHPNDGQRGYATAQHLPLQVVVGHGGPDLAGVRHLHPNNLKTVRFPTRHSVFVCLAGSIRVEVCEEDGTGVDQFLLAEGDSALVTEGHSVTFLTPDTRMIEVKQGPYPGSAENDRVLL